MASQEEQEMSSLSESQEKVLSILVASSSLLSTLGSFVILFRVAKKGWIKSTSYDRILCGLSFSDVMLSLSFGLVPFLLPAGSRVWSVGSKGTCAFLGFLGQWGIGTLWYNGVLAFYYLMTVRFGVRREVFARRYEPYIHGFILLFQLTTGLTGLIVGFFGELGT